MHANLFPGIVMKDIKYGVHIYTIELLPRFYCNALLYECLLTGRLHHTPGQWSCVFPSIM